MGFFMPPVPPPSLRESLPEDPENLRIKCRSAEALFLFTTKPKQPLKSAKKSSCTLMWGDDEDEEDLYFIYLFDLYPAHLV